MSFKNAARATTIAVEIVLPMLGGAGTLAAGMLEASNHKAPAVVVGFVSAWPIGRAASRSMRLRQVEQMLDPS